MNLKGEMRIEQKQVLSTKQLLSLELLSFNNVDLDVFLQNEYLENPLLDYTSNGIVPGETENFQQWFQNMEDRVQNIEAFIWDQLSQIKYTDEEVHVINTLIRSLDDTGFLSLSVDEIVELYYCNKQLVENCLNDLKHIEPYGIFSKDLSECILYQLDLLGVKDDTLYEIVCNYLDALADGKISKITRNLKISSLQVRKYSALITSLNPRPLSGFANQKTEYIVPDIIISNNDDNTYKIEINDNWIGDASVNEYYSKMISTTEDQDLLKYFQDKKSRVLFLRESIEKRRATIRSILWEIIKLQKGELKEKERFVPITMSRLAGNLNINVSTVSRAVKDKYIQYPRGTILMKDFFASSVCGVEENHSASQIKAELEKIIKTEDKTKPYSDTKLVTLLKEQGIVISRRGAAKYRDEIGIKGSYERKCYYD